MRKINLLLLCLIISCTTSAQAIMIDDLELDENEKAIWDSIHFNLFSFDNIAVADSLYLASKSNGHDDAKALALLIKSVPYMAAGDSLGLSYITEGMQICRKIGRLDSYFTFKYMKVMYYEFIGKYADIITEAREITSEASEVGSEHGLYLGYYAIGQAFVFRDNPRMAQKYFLQSLVYGKNLDDSQKINLYTNLANCYEAMDKKDSANLYMQKVKEYTTKGNNAMRIKIIEYTHLVIGDIRKPEDFIMEYERLNKSLCYDGLVDPEMIMMAKAKYWAYKGQQDSALYYANALGRGVNSLNMLEFVYKNFGDWENAFNCRFEAEMKHDSLQTVIQSEDFAAMDAQIGNTMLRLESERLENHNRIIMIASAFSIILILLGALAFVEISRKRTLQKQKAWLEAEVKRQTSEITAQASQIMDQNEKITAQRDSLAKANRDITASITYAKRVQTAAVPSMETMENLFGQVLVVWRPRDIVSGDFYWAASHGNKKLIAVADCTGHGVPGAFVSMLGISILNEIARNLHSDTQAADILNSIRSRIIKQLNQSLSLNSRQDGMDMAFCIIDSQECKIQYAGANRPLILVRDKQASEIKPDKMPVGIFIKNDNFTNQEISYMPGDWIYLFSDGIPDQFGYEHNKKRTRKFSQARLAEILAQNSMLSTEDQRKAIENAVDDWRKEEEQIDDQIVVGIRLQ